MNDLKCKGLSTTQVFVGLLGEEIRVKSVTDSKFLIIKGTNKFIIESSSRNGLFTNVLSLSIFDYKNLVWKDIISKEIPACDGKQLVNSNHFKDVIEILDEMF